MRGEVISRNGADNHLAPHPRPSPRKRGEGARLVATGLAMADEAD